LKNAEFEKMLVKDIALFQKLKISSKMKENLLHLTVCIFFYFEVSTVLFFNKNHFTEGNVCCSTVEHAFEKSALKDNGCLH